VVLLRLFVHRVADAGSAHDFDAAISFYAPDAVFDMASEGMSILEGRAEDSQVGAAGAAILSRGMRGPPSSCDQTRRNAPSTRGGRRRAT
jgi:hypothetical protein